MYSLLTVSARSLTKRRKACYPIDFDFFSNVATEAICVCTGIFYLSNLFPAKVASFLS